MSERIVVTAPTGHVGSRVVQLLLQAGARPTLLVRDPGRLDPAVRAAADVRQGDLTDPGFVREAAAGAEAAFWLDVTPHTADDPVQESAALGEVFAAAAREVGRNVFLSSGGAELRCGAGHIDGLGRVEELLDTTGAAVTHLRCGYFCTNLLADLDGLRQGVLAAARAPEEPMAWVDPRDIGEVAAARLLARDWSGRVVQGVHGPEDLTYSQVAAILTAVLDRPVTYHRLSDDDVRAALRAAGLGEGAVEGIVGMTAGTRGLRPDPPRTALTTTPTTLGEWAHRVLRPLME
ncbi:NAD(P)H-binding protein [Pseudonocardia sp. NPDC049154]|uniref:NmrA family NAD(P)-binding protein n=1 Tax=Pseudonocardia sp. NPDC049154 TaxID=3155501 RepID=UPI0033FF7F6F